ncbi:MAG: sulfurtransferase, partial [Candidatus Baltobacteraceae bacterium]
RSKRSSSTSSLFATIVSPEALRERLDDPALVVVDCRHALADLALGRRLYDESHVPGAFFASVEDDLAGEKTGKNGRHPMPDPEVFARFLRGMGVDDATQIVAYDEGADIFAARLWFLCRWIGHDATAVLDGGFAAWNALGYPVTGAPSRTRREGHMTIRLRPELLVDAAFVAEHLGDPAMQLLDARARERYAGETEPIDPVAGHIPGAAHRWFEENFDGDGRLKSPQRLREEFARAGLDPRRTVHQCGSGLSAAVTHLAMTHAGLEGSRLYAGSWSEWCADPSRPVETGS